MSAPKGNRYAAGSCGGGRPSAYTEQARADLLHEAFFGETDLSYLKDRLERKTKKCLWDVMLLKALDGNENFIGKMFDKIFPTPVKGDLNVHEKPETPKTPAERKARINELLDRLNTDRDRELARPG